MYSLDSDEKFDAIFFRSSHVRLERFSFVERRVVTYFLQEVVIPKSRSQECLVEQRLETVNLVEFWGLLPLILFLNVPIGWVLRFVLSTECYRTRRPGYKDLNWPRCSARVTESLALTDGGFCQKQTLYILDYVKIVSL